MPPSTSLSTGGLVGESQGPRYRRAKLGGVGGRGPCEPHPDQRGLENIQEAHPGFSQPWGRKTRSVTRGNFKHTCLAWQGSAAIAITRKFQQRALFPNNTKREPTSRKVGEPRASLLPPARRLKFPALCKVHKENITIQTN